MNSIISKFGGSWSWNGELTEDSIITFANNDQMSFGALIGHTHGDALQWWLDEGMQGVSKHLAGQHDQSTHGNWADAITHEINAWNPLDPVPSSPRNAGGFTARAQEAWEHGPDGTQFVELFRKYACQALGLPVPKTPYDKGGYLEYMLERGWGAPNRNEVKGLLKAITNSKPQPVLWRGMQSSEDDQLTQDFKDLKTGDVFDMPLVSTTRSQGAAQWYAAERGRGQNAVLMKIQAGAKGWAFGNNAYYTQDSEVIVSGKFQVVGVTKVKMPYWARHHLIARKVSWTDGTPDAWVAYDTGAGWVDNKSETQKKQIFDALGAKDMSAFESKDVTFSLDRNSGNDWERTATLWTRQPDKEFTVVEVKMIEPHVVSDEVAKSKGQDLGNKFYWLFNDRPFINQKDPNKPAMG